MDHTNPHEWKPEQLTRDDCARISANAINSVLEKLGFRQIDTSIAVFPAGEGVFLVDIVMRDTSTNKTWSVSLTIPPVKEGMDA